MKQPDLKPGKYVLAVSGGVDSMVLLDMLSNLTNVDFAVAHFNHGIRPDSAEDEKLVSEAAGRYGRPLEIGRAALGPGASEEAARAARYALLESVRKKYRAKKIITAHHQDDLIETALINTIRGTGRRGLSSMALNKKISRPLLNTPKSEILNYAKSRGIVWREDSTNKDDAYLRNYLRNQVLGRMTTAQRRRLLDRLEGMADNNTAIDERLEKLSRKVRKDLAVDRRTFSELPAAVAAELLAYWLRDGRFGEMDKREINRLSLAIKTAPAGSSHNLKGSARLVMTKDKANFLTTP